MSVKLPNLIMEQKLKINNISDQFKEKKVETIPHKVCLKIYTSSKSLKNPT